MLLTRDHTTSPQYDNLGDICDIENSLIIEVEVTKYNKKIGQLKDDSVYLLNDAKHIFQERPLEKLVDNYNKMNENFILLIN